MSEEKLYDTQRPLKAIGNAFPWDFSDMENDINLFAQPVISIMKTLLSFRSPALVISSVQQINNPAGFDDIFLARLIFILFMKSRTDILTQERVVIRSTTNYVVSCTHIFTLHTPQILSTRKGPFMTTLCEQAMFFRQRKPCIPCLITRQRRRCIGANTLYTLLPASVKRRATGLFWQGFYHH